MNLNGRDVNSNLVSVTNINGETLINCLVGGEECSLCSWSLEPQKSGLIVNKVSTHPTSVQFHTMHISNIRSLELSKPEGSWILSGGGRGQFCVWQNICGDLKPQYWGSKSLKAAKDCDLRIMSIQGIELNTSSMDNIPMLLLVISCSDGTIRLVTMYSKNSKVKFQEILKIDTGTDDNHVFCLLCSFLEIDELTNTYLNFNVFVGDTSGRLQKFYLNCDLSDMDTINERNERNTLPCPSEIERNQQILTNCSLNCLEVLSNKSAIGGFDDGSLRIANADLNRWTSCMLKHYAALVDMVSKSISSSEDVVISLAADHNVISWRVKNQELICCNLFQTNGLGDPHCISYCEDKKAQKQYVLVSGIGHQLLEIDMKSFINR